MNDQPSHTDLHATTAVRWDSPNATPIADLQSVLMVAHLRYGYDPIALRIHPTDWSNMVESQVVHSRISGSFSADELNLWLARNLGVVIHSQPGTESGKVFVLDRYGQVLALLVVG